jgi:hypothetical protein
MNAGDFLLKGYHCPSLGPAPCASAYCSSHHHQKHIPKLRNLDLCYPTSCGDDCMVNVSQIKHLDGRHTLHAARDTQIAGIALARRATHPNRRAIWGSKDFDSRSLARHLISSSRSGDKVARTEFIDKNGGGPGVRHRKRQRQTIQIRTTARNRSDPPIQPGKPDIIVKAAANWNKIGKHQHAYETTCGRQRAAL